MRSQTNVDDTWIRGFFGEDHEDSHSLPEAPPPSPDRDLVNALAEAMDSGAPPRLNLPPTYLKDNIRPPPVSLSAPTQHPHGWSNPLYLSDSSRRRSLVGHAPRLHDPPPPPSQITVAQRQYYSRAQQNLYSGGGDHAGLAALAKAAGKRGKTKGNATGSRWITTKSKRVLKVSGSKKVAKKTKDKTKKKKHGRKSLSRSWPSSRDSFSSGYNYSDYSERQAERAEMERRDRK